MIVVLGGGPAGRIASIRLASAGKKVTLVESGGIGGQCLHFGCMPVCALNDTARMVSSARMFTHLGIMDGVPRINFPHLLTEMHAIQQKIASILDQETRTAGVDIVYGKAGRIDGPYVYIGDDQVTAEAVIAATGSHPQIPAVDGITLPGVYTPHTLPAMKSLPEKMVIIGGGVMAAEFAYIFSSFGSNVTVLSRSAFLKNIDRHLYKIAVKELSGVKIRENAGVKAIQGSSRAEAVEFASGDVRETVDADAIMIAAGLLPNSDMITGVKKGPLGELMVNDRMQTSVPGVYAAGDVTGPPYLTPVARHEGIVAADNILGMDRRMDYRFIPQSINLTHELAFCGAGGAESASLAIPGRPGRGRSGRSRPAIPGLQKLWLTRIPVRSPVCVQQGLVGG